MASFNSIRWRVVAVALSCVECWGLGRIDVMLIGTTPCVAVYFPHPPPLLGVRLLTVKHVWFALLPACFVDCVQSRLSVL